jgi:plastocyanin
MVTCGDHPVPITDQKVVVKNNGLDNVVIYLKNAPPSTTTANLAPALLDQKQCVYVPHVLALRTGQSLMVINDENLLHNVHTLPEFNPSLNFGMTCGSSHNVVFNKAEIFTVKCDVHPWMSAWIAVFDHPWFAVTSNGGKFAISHVPAGPQTFVAWHERFGEIEQTVTITTDQAREIAFNFEPPKEK